MAMLARVAWAAVEEPWLVEKRLLATTSLPLNLQGNAPSVRIYSEKYPQSGEGEC